MKKLLFSFFIVLFAFGENIEITKFVSNKKPLVRVEYKNLNNKLLRVMKKDFKVISHFRYELKRVNSVKKELNYSDYNSSNYLIKIIYKKNSLKVYGYDLYSQKMILNKSYKIPSFKYYPFMIHNLSSDINDIIKAPTVEWIKRKIVYSVYTAPKESELFIADYSLTFRKRIVQGGLNVFPKWADNKQTTIYYTSLTAKPILYRFNIYTGKRDKIISSNGMLVVSDVKGNELLLTMAIDDQPDIYMFNIVTKKLRQLTKYRDIDVSGKFYGKNSIAFISNRLDKPYVYEKNLKTGDISKLLHFGKNQIALSTFNDWSVISSRESSKSFNNNTFNLFLSQKNRNVIKRLTFNGKNISPEFSMDGTTIIFIKDYHFSSKIGIIRLKENLIFYYPLSKKLQSLDW